MDFKKNLDENMNLNFKDPEFKKEWAALGDDIKKLAANKKPPMGLTPRYIWDENRRQAILDAMERYTLDNKPVPDEWVEELMDMQDKLYYADVLNALYKKHDAQCWKWKVLLAASNAAWIAVIIFFIR